MLTDMIMAYVYAETEKEKKHAERDARKLGIDKHTLDVMAAEYLEDTGNPVMEKERK